jgi:hypothetical protein
MQSDFYPDLTWGDDIVFATDPNAPPQNWFYGKVAMPKNHSADLAVYVNGIWEFRHDCLHADDPSITTNRSWTERGRGVFRLAPRELSRRAADARLPDLEMRMAWLERNLQAIVAGTCQVTPPIVPTTLAPTLPLPSADPALAVRRRPGRPPKVQSQTTLE